MEYYLGSYPPGSDCDSRYCLLYQLIIVTVSARMLFGTDAHVV